MLVTARREVVSVRRVKCGPSHAPVLRYGTGVGGQGTGPDDMKPFCALTWRVSAPRSINCNEMHHVINCMEPFLRS